jgi:hypothetical protein
MKHRMKLTHGQLGFIVGTRAALATGIALLAGARMPPRVRRAVGIGLVALGAATTVPVVRSILRAR